jgi:Fic family protein
MAAAALARLDVGGTMVPSADWFLYGFVRKEAVVSSQIEGTQATLRELIAWEATEHSTHPADVEEVCNYVRALSHARGRLAAEHGLPLCTRLLSEAHELLLEGTRGRDKQPGRIRTSQNWIGGTRPGNAAFVPPPPDAVGESLSALERWLHDDDPLPALVRAGLAHVQFETIHPYLDGNGRIGRLLITLLLEHWRLLGRPLLYLSLAFKRRRREYYRRLSAVRAEGDWEGWTAFFLECVAESADDGVDAARRIFELLGNDRRAVANHPRATLAAVRLFDRLPEHPMVTLSRATEMLDATKPTAARAIETLRECGILAETTGRRRDRVYAYEKYLSVLTEDAGVPEG